jgi:hypothetical protein
MFFRSSIARPTDTPIYASSETSRHRPQDSGPRWSRFILSCRAISSPTTCRFIPAHPDKYNSRRIRQPEHIEIAGAMGLGVWDWDKIDLRKKSLT